MRSRLTQALIALCCVAILTPSLIAADSGIAIEWNPREAANPVWLGYLMSRALYRERQKLPIPRAGEIIPTFSEEVTARSDALQIYRELRAKGGARVDPYWEDLAKIDAKKFMRAYVWTFLRQSSWPRSEEPSDVAAFQRWRDSALKNHRIETHGPLVGNRK